MLKSAGGGLTVTDGPFAEAEGPSGGSALIEAGSREEALELSRRFFKIVNDAVVRMEQIY
ncbi:MULTISPECIES: YciI family protein [Streptosporangium]|uniref:YCII-related domain-containing protein n=1 Tax=Streptosporangium brasiliense TaxID=47480 RepID=A0ABT9R6I4_9ACTN|nr:YciI family protein [Streptosporangium brasiliense]MDP9864857.1 hypothetical protein [Streptosporangium brasiliense]